MNERQRAALFREIHRAIEESATSAVLALAAGAVEPSYPPNAGLTQPEQQAIRELKISSNLHSALRKVVADAASAPLFKLFALLDGVADPESFDGEWSTFAIQETDEDDPESPMLHDELFESYWSWLEVRPERRWRLDTCEG